jgi:hypothetical protein
VAAGDEEPADPIPVSDPPIAGSSAEAALAAVVPWPELTGGDSWFEGRTEVAPALGSRRAAPGSAAEVSAAVGLADASDPSIPTAG